MSLMIKGMDVPNNCFNCPCCGEFTDTIAQIREYNCQALDDKPICVISGRRTDCPLSEIPTPHGRLIDADALSLCDIDVANYPSNYIKRAPTIIEAEE